MKVGKIEGGQIANVIQADSVAWAESALGGDWIEMPQGAGIGWGWDGTSATPPTATPESRLRLTRGEFRDQFTVTEKQAIYTAAETSVDIRIFLDDLMSVNHVDLDFPKTIDSMTQLESLGLIGEGRAAEILAGID